MKRIVILLFLVLISSIAFGQKIQADVIKFTPDVTTAERDTYDVPTGEHWLIWNVTTFQLEVGNDAEVWTAVGSGGGGSDDDITSAVLNGNILEINEGATQITVDLSQFLDDTTLTNAQVAAAVNSEFPNLDTDDTDDFNGDYNSLTNTPTIPTNNNQLTNGAGYITTESDDQQIDLFNLDGNTLELSLENDGQATQTVDLSSLGGGSGATQLSELSDVGTSTPTAGNILIGDGTDFDARPLVAGDIPDLSGTYLTAEVDGSVTNEIQDADEVNILDTGSNFTATNVEDALAELFAATGTAWGSITGTLSSQTDLQAALDAKGGLADTQTWTGVNTLNQTAVTSQLQPRTDDQYDLGTTSFRYRNIRLSGNLFTTAGQLRSSDAVDSNYANIDPSGFTVTSTDGVNSWRIGNRDGTAVDGRIAIRPQSSWDLGNNIFEFDYGADDRWEIDGSPIITAANAASNGIGGSGSTDYISNVTFDGTNLNFSNVGSAFSGAVDISSLSGGSDDDITDVDFDGTNLTVTEGATSFSADISSVDTQLSDSEVATAVNNEFPNLDTDSTDDFDGTWGSLTGIPAGFADGVDDVGTGGTINGLASVATVDDLRTFSASDGDLVFAEGYVSSSDGGGGFFIYNASGSHSAEDGGTVIGTSTALATQRQNYASETASPSGGTGRWERIIENRLDIDPKWWGITYGNGNTDQWSVLQSAVNFAEETVTSMGGSERATIRIHGKAKFAQTITNAGIATWKGEAYRKSRLIWIGGTTATSGFSTMFDVGNKGSFGGFVDIALLPYDYEASVARTEAIDHIATYSFLDFGHKLENIFVGGSNQSQFYMNETDSNEHFTNLNAEGLFVDMPTNGYLFEFDIPNFGANRSFNVNRLTSNNNGAPGGKGFFRGPACIDVNFTEGRIETDNLMNHEEFTFVEYITNTPARPAQVHIERMIGFTGSPQTYIPAVRAIVAEDVNLTSISNNMEALAGVYDKTLGRYHANAPNQGLIINGGKDFGAITVGSKNVHFFNYDIRTGGPAENVYIKKGDIAITNDEFGDFIYFPTLDDKIYSNLVAGNFNFRSVNFVNGSTTITFRGGAVDSSIRPDLAVTLRATGMPDIQTYVVSVDNVNTSFVVADAPTQTSDGNIYVTEAPKAIGFWTPRPTQPSGFTTAITESTPVFVEDQNKFIRWNGTSWVDAVTGGGGGSDGVVSNVGFDGTNLNFTGTNGGFNGAVDISSLAGGTDDQTAAEVTVSTTNFDGNLSGSDTSVQAALETLDDVALGSGNAGNFDSSEMTDGGTLTASDLSNSSNGTVYVKNTTTTDKTETIDNLNGGAANERYVFFDGVENGVTKFTEGTMTFSAIDKPGSADGFEVLDGGFVQGVELTDGTLTISGDYLWTTSSAPAGTVYRYAVGDAAGTYTPLDASSPDFIKIGDNFPYNTTNLDITGTINYDGVNTATSVHSSVTPTGLVLDDFNSDLSGEIWGSSFTIDVKNLAANTPYTLRYYVMESAFGGTFRIFDITANGTLVVDDADPFGDFGGQNVMGVYEFTATSDGSGVIQIVATASVNNATFYNLEVISQ